MPSLAGVVDTNRETMFWKVKLPLTFPEHVDGVLVEVELNGREVRVWDPEWERTLQPLDVDSEEGHEELEEALHLIYATQEYSDAVGG